MISAATFYPSNLPLSTGSNRQKKLGREVRSLASLNICGMLDVRKNRRELSIISMRGATFKNWDIQTYFYSKASHRETTLWPTWATSGWRVYWRLCCFWSAHRSRGARRETRGTHSWRWTCNPLPNQFCPAKNWPYKRLTLCILKALLSNAVETRHKVASFSDIG